MKRVLVLGGGAGGAILASRLSKKLRGRAEIVVVDKSLYHEFRPSYLWVAMGVREPDDVRRPLNMLEKRGVRFINEEIVKIDLADRRVATDRRTIEYDYLAISLGAVLRPDLVRGLEKISHPWELDTALRLREELRGFRGGRVVVGPTRTPYRCPPAPLEIAFMIRYLSETRGVGDKTEITVVHPEWQRPMEPFGPFMSSMFTRFLETYRIRFLGKWEVEYVDTEKKTVVGRNGEKLGYDLAVLVPPHEAPRPVKENPDLLDETTGFMKIDKKRLTHPRYTEVYGLGDVIAPTIGLGMAGVFAHFQADYISARIADEILGTYMDIDYNKSGVCVMDLGYIGAGAYCDFSPTLEGRSAYPSCYMLGGMAVLRLVKMFFEKYWFREIFG